MKPFAVVFGWAGFNAVLAGIMLAYGESLEFVGLYTAAVLLTVAVGLLVLLATRRPADRPTRLAAGSGSSAFLALAAVLFGLGFLYTHWLSYLALFPLLFAAHTFGRERLRPGTVPAATEIRTSPVVPRAEHRVLERAARAVTLVATAARVISALRPGGRRS